MTNFLLAIVALAAVVIAVVFMVRRGGTSAGDRQALDAMRTELNALRETTDKSIQSITTIFSTQLRDVTTNVQTAMARVNSDVGNRLDTISQTVSQRLNENAAAMTQATGSVNDRIANVQNTFAGLQQQIGQMGEQARQLGEMSKSISDLQHILTAPKLRGGFGEEQLETLLATVFAREQYELQYRFASSGEIADAVVFFPQGMVAIDSKFSLENFRRMAQASGDGDRKIARRDFLKDVRKRVDEIATKYVRPADGTLPFALMYIPAENVYYEAILRDEDGNDLYSYCFQKKVVPVSPNSLYAYLQTIVVGLKSMHVSQRAQAILGELESLRVELDKFNIVYEKLGRHMKNASNSYEESGRALGKLEDHVERLAGSGPKQMDLAIAEEKQRALTAAGQ
ncbi:MAG: DNA recombination protein RmuC [Acidobacteria bacterium]|nr:DNA recombination protein RmuC [Acidobacteriota bacterium]